MKLEQIGRMLSWLAPVDSEALEPPKLQFSPQGGLGSLACLFWAWAPLVIWMAWV